MTTTMNHSRRLRFSTQLRQAIDEKGISIRSLSREVNPQSPETARSNISRWLRASHMPSRTSRRKLAVVLGLPADHFESDDDEESDVISVLFTAVRSIVRSEMKRERETTLAGAHS